MKKAIDFIKWSLSFPITMLSVFYAFWFLSLKINETFVNGLILLAIYLVITVLANLSSKHWTLSLVLFVILLPIAGYATLLAIWLRSWGGEQGIPDHIAAVIAWTVFIAIYPLVTLWRNSSGQKRIFSILLFFITIPILAFNIYYFLSCYPKVVKKAEFGEFKYYITSERDMDFHSYLTFYKCKKWTFDCSGLYGTYNRQDFDRIIFDDVKNEVSAVGDSRLVYTDGKNPRLYDGYPEQLGNHTYLMSTDFVDGGCNTSTYCDTYIYTLYECEVGYTLCNQLPVRYQENYDVVIVLKKNETTREINAYDNYDDTLIFTYGEHPRCYVEGCVITDINP